MRIGIIDKGLGRTIAFLERLTHPRALVRTADAQRAVEKAVQSMCLYHQVFCPFCIKTRRAIRRLDLPIELRDVRNEPAHRAALAAGGGKVQVPCLRIDEDGVRRWLYESSDIIAYLEQRFAADGPPDDTARMPRSNANPSTRAAAVQDGGVQTGPLSRVAPEPVGALRPLLWLSLLACGPAQADQDGLRAYECTNDGVKTFSDQPCGRVERRVFLGYSSPKQPIDAEGADSDLAADVAAPDVLGDRIELERAIARAEGRIADLRKAREIAIDQLLVGRTDGAAITSVGQAPGTAAWLDPQQLGTPEPTGNRTDNPGDNPDERIRVVKTRYAEDIAVEEQRIEQLREYLATMQ